MASTGQRQQWTRPHHFLLASLSYTLGLGTVYRLPALFYRHGGVAFLLPYFSCILLLGLPLLAVEVAVGQTFQAGAATAWASLVPLSRGLALAALTLAAIVNVYYIVVVAWSGQYFLEVSGGALSVITRCHNIWNTGSNCSNPEEEFFRRRILDAELLGETPLAFEAYQTNLLVMLLISWILVFLLLVGGPRSIRCGSLFTGILPPVTMISLSVLALFLPGAFNGIGNYLAPRFYKIYSTRAWLDAAKQVLFSYGIGLGALTALGSYNSSGARFGRQLKQLVAMHATVGLFTVFGFYALVGYLMENSGGVAPAVKELQGTGAIFVLIPRALASLPGATFWAMAFYMLIFLLGLGSQAMTVEGVMLAAEDALFSFSGLFSSSKFSFLKRRVLLLSAYILPSFVFGLMLVKRNGIETFDIFDSFGAPIWTLNLVAAAQCLLFGRYTLPVVEAKTGVHFGPVSRVIIQWVTPVLLILLQIFESYKFLEFLIKSLNMPFSRLFLGWNLLLAPLLMALLGTLFEVCRRKLMTMMEGDLQKKLDGSSSQKQAFI